VRFAFALSLFLVGSRAKEIECMFTKRRRIRLVVSWASAVGTT